jgi:hypothetical protein
MLFVDGSFSESKQAESSVRRAAETTQWPGGPGAITTLGPAQSPGSVPRVQHFPAWYQISPLAPHSPKQAKLLRLCLLIKRISYYFKL